jgi:hypothetical protein
MRELQPPEVSNRNWTSTAHHTDSLRILRMRTYEPGSARPGLSRKAEHRGASAAEPRHVNLRVSMLPHLEPGHPDRRRGSQRICNFKSVSDAVTAVIRQPRHQLFTAASAHDWCEDLCGEAGGKKDARSDPADKCLFFPDASMDQCHEEGTTDGRAHLHVLSQRKIVVDFPGSDKAKACRVSLGSTFIPLTIHPLQPRTTSSMEASFTLARISSSLSWY